MRELLCGSESRLMHVLPVIMANIAAVKCFSTVFAFTRVLTRIMKIGVKNGIFQKNLEFYHTSLL